MDSMWRLVQCLIFYTIISSCGGTFNFNIAQPPLLSAVEHKTPPQSIYIPHFRYAASPLSSPLLPPPPTPSQGCFLNPCPIPPNQWISNSRGTPSILSPSAVPIPIHCIFHSIVPGPAGPPGPPGPPGVQGPPGLQSPSGQSVPVATTLTSPVLTSTRTVIQNDVIKSEAKTSTIPPTPSSPLPPSVPPTSSSSSSSSSSASSSTSSSWQSLSSSTSNSVQSTTTESYSPTTFNIDLLGESDLQNDIKKESRSFLGINF